MYNSRESIVDIELNTGTLFRSFTCNVIGEGDEKANVFGGKLYRNGAPVDITNANVNGYFIRADGATVVIEGTATGNQFSVTLPKSCYAIEGKYTLAIKVSGGGISGTMRIVDGTVENTSTSAAIDPGGVVPEIDELMAVIGRAEAAAEEIANYIVYDELIEGDDYRIIVDFEEQGG